MFILASQAKKVFYVQDELNQRWLIVLSTPQNDFTKRANGNNPMDISIEHNQVIFSFPQLNYLMQWMTLIKFVFNMIVREFGLRTNLICNQTVPLLWYCELICYYSFL